MKTDVPILKRLGPVPYWRGQDRCLDSLRVIYEKAMEDARRKRAAAAAAQRLQGAKAQTPG